MPLLLYIVFTECYTAFIGYNLLRANLYNQPLPAACGDAVNFTVLPGVKAPEFYSFHR